MKVLLSDTGQCIVLGMIFLFITMGFGTILDIVTGG